MTSNWTSWGLLQDSWRIEKLFKKQCGILIFSLATKEVVWWRLSWRLCLKYGTRPRRKSWKLWNEIFSHSSLVKMQFLHKWKWISTSCYLALASAPVCFSPNKNWQSWKSHLSGNVVERFVFLGMSLCGQKNWATHLRLQVFSVPLPQMYRIKNRHAVCF